MKSLSKDWLTEKHIDFEYKKYILLAYLKEVSENFDQSRLFPYLSDMVEHYRNIVAIKENKKDIYDSFPKRADKADFEKFKLIYSKMVEDDEIMQALESIINFSIPKFQHYLAEGKKIYDFIENHLYIYPVGISPLNESEGYLFLRNGGKKDAKVYEYQISIFDDAHEKYRAIRTNYLATYTIGISNTFESIKTDLIRYNKKLPNPATYAVETDFSIPAEETFLPIAKRILVRYIAQKQV